MIKTGIQFYIGMTLHTCYLNEHTAVEAVKAPSQDVMYRVLIDRPIKREIRKGMTLLVTEQNWNRLSGLQAQVTLSVPPQKYEDMQSAVKEVYGFDVPATAAAGLVVAFDIAARQEDSTTISVCYVRFDLGETKSRNSAESNRYLNFLRGQIGRSTAANLE